MIDYNILNKLSESELRRLVMRYSDKMNAMSKLIQAQGERIADLEHINASLKKLHRCGIELRDCKRDTDDVELELISKYSQPINTCEDAEDKEDN